MFLGQIMQISTTAIKCFEFVVDVNFYISLVVIIMGSALSLTENYSIFEFSVDIYSELANHLRSIMAYLAVTELCAFLYCFITKEYHYFILSGFFLLLIIGSLQFYGQLNNVETDPNLDLCLLYAGLSHLLFGVTAFYKRQRILDARAK
jgi:hypothetical protein